MQSSFEDNQLIIVQLHRLTIVFYPVLAKVMEIQLSNLLAFLTSLQRTISDQMYVQVLCHADNHKKQPGYQTCTRLLSLDLQHVNFLFFYWFSVKLHYSHITVTPS